MPEVVSASLVAEVFPNSTSEPLFIYLYRFEFEGGEGEVKWRVVEDGHV